MVTPKQRVASIVHTRKYKPLVKDYDAPFWVIVGTKTFQTKYEFCGRNSYLKAKGFIRNLSKKKYIVDGKTNVRVDDVRLMDVLSYRTLLYQKI
jgi:hypothetical protein